MVLVDEVKYSMYILWTLKMIAMNTHLLTLRVHCGQTLQRTLSPMIKEAELDVFVMWRTSFINGNVYE